MGLEDSVIMVVAQADAGSDGVSVEALAGIAAAFIAALVAIYGAARTRLHERSQQIRERMLIAADETLEAFQRAGHAISALLSERRPTDRKELAAALAEAETLCGVARVRAARIALLFHPNSPSRHVAFRTVEALERLYELAKTGTEPMPKWIEDLAGPAPAPSEGAWTEQTSQATGLLQTIDAKRWDNSAYYRLAVFELGQSFELFMKQVWHGLQSPLQTYPSELSFVRHGIFTHPEVVREELGLDKREAALPHKRASRWLGDRWTWRRSEETSELREKAGDRSDDRS